MRFIILIIGLMWLFVGAGCRTVRYVPVETVRTEVEYRDRVETRRDSVFLRDSVFVRQLDDTVYVERWHTEYHDRQTTDTVTVYAERVDSVAVPYEVERPMTKWERTKQEVGGIAIGVAVAVMLATIAWLIWHKPK